VLQLFPRIHVPILHSTKLYVAVHELLSIKHSDYFNILSSLGFLSGFVIAPFAFFNFKGAALDALIVKVAMITYAVMFSYIALVGRIAFVIRQGNADGTMDRLNNQFMSRSDTYLSKTSDVKVRIWVRITLDDHGKYCHCLTESYL
jgi:hypothetical protein